MKLKLLSSTKELSGIFQRWCAKAEDIRFVAAWATADCPEYSSLTAARNAISTMVVGLDFYTTSPSFLRKFRSVTRIGDADGIFHPKVYLFKKGNSYCCIIGSSNFTSGGFGDNTELNVCIEGGLGDSFFADISKFFDRQEQYQSSELSTPELDDYEAQFEHLKASRARLAKFHAGEAANAKAEAKRVKQAEGQEPPEQLNKTWAEFFNIILAQEKRPGLIIKGTKDEPGYLETAERCQKLFAQYGRLTKMPEDERKFVGGTIKKAAWFGHMGSNGLFKQRLNNDPASLDTALDKIPQSGAVNKRSFSSFASNYKWDKLSVATASRLLAMKRPDLFLCVDSKNKSPLAKAFGISVSSLDTFDGYWNLLQRIWKCRWWRAEEPNDPRKRRIWSARVALLDSIYYKMDQ